MNCTRISESMKFAKKRTGPKTETALFCVCFLGFDTATGMSHLSKEEDVAATATGVTYVQGCSHDRTKDHGIRLL